MNLLKVCIFVALVAICAAGGKPGGNPNGGGHTATSDEVCPNCPPRPEADPNCVPKKEAQKDKVAICHGTASESNPYVLIVVDDASTWEGHFSGGGPGHGKKNHPDIWPNSIGYDGLLYDCNCERPPAPPPAGTTTGVSHPPEVLTVASVNILCSGGAPLEEVDSVLYCPSIDEDSPVTPSFGLDITTDGVTQDSCIVELSGLPDGASLEGCGTCGPVDGSKGNQYQMTCDEFSAMTSIILPDNHDSDVPVTVTVTLAGTSIYTGATLEDTATRAFTFRVTPINDAPEVTLEVLDQDGNVVSYASGLHPTVDSVWGWKTYLPNVRIADVDLHHVHPDTNTKDFQGNPLLVKISVEHGMLGFSESQVLSLLGAVDTAEDPSEENFQDMVIAAGTFAGDQDSQTCLSCFTSIVFRVSSIGADVKEGDCNSAECRASKILNSLFYVADVGFVGDDSITIAVDDLGSYGECPLGTTRSAGSLQTRFHSEGTSGVAALWCPCTSHEFTISVSVECETTRPTSTTSSDLVYGALKGTVYNPSQGGGWGNEDQEKIAICHSTAAKRSVGEPAHITLVVSQNTLNGPKGHLPDDGSLGHPGTGFPDFLLGNRSAFTGNTFGDACILDEVEGSSTCSSRLNCFCDYVSSHPRTRTVWTVTTDDDGNTVVSLGRIDTATNLIVGASSADEEGSGAVLGPNGAVKAPETAAEEESGSFGVVETISVAAGAMVFLVVLLVVVKRRNRNSHPEAASPTFDIDLENPSPAHPHPETFVEEFSAGESCTSLSMSLAERKKQEGMEASQPMISQGNERHVKKSASAANAFRPY